ncbi:MAG: hypothetical protein ACLP52_31260 [Streptosporangiaceae bacterium]
MTETANGIPGYVTITEPHPIEALTRIAAELIAANADLPAPRYLSVSRGGQEISLQFADDPSSFDALARWAERFGGTITGEPGTDAENRPRVYCVAAFRHGGAAVTAYAFVRTATAA